jgi:hypothetical protein
VKRSQVQSADNEVRIVSAGGVLKLRICNVVVNRLVQEVAYEGTEDALKFRKADSSSSSLIRYESPP